MQPSAAATISLESGRRIWRRSRLHPAPRIITGCLIISPIEHLHCEACMLPVKEHNPSLSMLFLLGWFRRNQPSRHLFGAESTPSNIEGAFLQYVNEEQNYTDQISITNNFRQDLNDIHNEAINTFIDSLSVSSLLRAETPPIAELQLELPRETRVTPVQLPPTIARNHSGYWSRLCYDLSKIGIPNLCLTCKESYMTLTGFPHASWNQLIYNPFPMVRHRRNSLFPDLTLSDFNYS